METYPIPNAYRQTCPTRQVLDRVGDKWTILIYGVLSTGPKRFSEIQRAIEGISQKMLSQTLRSLERDGLVQRTVYPVTPPKVEYALTELGETLCEPINSLQEWAYQYISHIENAQQAFDARDE